MSQNTFLIAANVRAQLQEEVNYYGGVNAFARVAKMTGGHVSRVLRGEKEPGAKVLNWLGLRAVTVYQPKPASGVKKRRKPLVIPPFAPNNRSA